MPWEDLLGTVFPPYLFLLWGTLEQQDKYSLSPRQIFFIFVMIWLSWEQLTLRWKKRDAVSWCGVGMHHLKSSWNRRNFFIVVRTVQVSADFFCVCVHTAGTEEIERHSWRISGFCFFNSHFEVYSFTAQEEPWVMKSALIGWGRECSTSKCLEWRNHVNTRKALGFIEPNYDCSWLLLYV